MWHTMWLFVLLHLFSGEFQYPDEPFLNMEGERLTHTINDTLTIHELRSQDGFTKWYGQDLTTEVCLTGLCNEVHLWLFWDCLGNYLGFQVFENEPLTKSDHEPFVRSDYQLLHEVLKDENSIFRFVTIDDLVIEKEGMVGLDGISGATNPDLLAFASEGAIYTFYTLWHSTHGQVKEYIQQLKLENNTEDYIKGLFNNESPEYHQLALDLLATKEGFVDQFSGELVGVMSSGDETLALEALRVSKLNWLLNPTNQLKLIDHFPDLSSRMRAEVVWTLSDLSVRDSNVIRNLFQAFDEELIGVNELRLVFQMIDCAAYSRFTQTLSRYAEHENAYIRRLISNLSSKCM